MLALVPDPWIPGSEVVGGGSDDGVETDVSISIRPGGAQQPFTVRTLVRTGRRMHPTTGVVHGVATDWVSIASMAATGLLLQTFPEGLQRAEAKRLARTVVAQGDELARDHASWSFTPMVLERVAYALRFRILDQGFVAHADVGGSALAAWGTGPLPPALSRVHWLESSGVPHPTDAPPPPD
ncbi:hypothetical protein B0I08_103258 [Glaciihabitans tibetensis]|uniref:Uncharacterized protein n=1 Tax=Glaciihabitans tibetensis TaxID=1266600 RepID=A0A2T0VFW0_9MICO|nr:hypothetical protein [Glaciihabitans tibetensis]PRY69052.1 hypothetical protein B0I08_103258 [Glaciihabitans tibetensis]